MSSESAAVGVPLPTIVREWGRIGCVGFGGPPTHIKLLRQLCVERRGWIDERAFEDGLAACNLLPGPASTQLSIYCAWRLRRLPGAILGGLAFILPGLVVILGLAALFLEGHPPRAVLGAGAGAGAAVAAVAVRAGGDLLPTSWQRAASRARWSLYVVSGGVAAALVGPWLVLVLLACGLFEWALRQGSRSALSMVALGGGSAGSGSLLSLCWVALKVGALSYGGGFVIIPLMQSDAVHRFHWMTAAQFLNAVALGQLTPGPAVQTVAVVGYAAGGIGGGLLASAVAFTPSFVFVVAGAPRFDRLRSNAGVRAFLDGAGPAAIGAILGSAVTLARALSFGWQYPVLAAAALALVVLRRGVVFVLLVAGLAGVVVAVAGGPIPG